MNGRPPDVDPVRPAAGGWRAPAGGQDAMSGATLERKVVIVNPEGFHMRPLAAFAETAMRFQSRVTVSKEGVDADGKSALALMGLAAEQGTRLVVRVCGPDAQAALDALLGLMTGLALAAEDPDPPAAENR